jgi:hypothetical protein
VTSSSATVFGSDSNPEHLQSLAQKQTESCQMLHGYDEGPGGYSAIAAAEKQEVTISSQDTLSIQIYHF